MIKMANNKKIHLNELNEKLENKIDKKTLVKELIQYFPHLKKGLTKKIIDDEINRQVLLNSLSSYKNCLINKVCDESNYHNIPYIEINEDNEKIIYIKREPCKFSKNSYINKKWMSYFLLDDYSAQNEEDFASVFASAKDVNIDSDTLKKLVSKLYNKETNRYDSLISFLIINKNISEIEALFHTYGIRQAKNEINTSYIDLINFYNANKNKYLDSTKYDEYIYAFKNSELLIFTNLDSFPIDDASWSALFSNLSMAIKKQKFLIFILKMDFIQILNNALEKNKTTTYSLIVETIELIKNYVSK